MSAYVRDVRCLAELPNGKRCDRKLAEAISVTVGWIEIKCPRCGTERRVEVAPKAVQQPSEHAGRQAA